MAISAPTTAASPVLGRRSGSCAATGKPLEPGEHAVAILRDVQDEQGVWQVERLDFSASAYDPGKAPHDFIARWQFVVPERAASNEPALDAGSLLDLLGQLVESTEDQDAQHDHSSENIRGPLAYLLALLLIRKRLLVTVGSAGRGALVVRPKNADDDESMTIREPSLDTESLSRLAASLNDLLGLDDQ